MELRTRLRIAALAAGLVALLAIVALAARAGRGGLPGGGAIGGPSVGFYDFAFTFVLVLGGLLLLAGAYAARRRGPQLPAVPHVISLPEELSLAFDKSLEDLRAERDPRRAVIAAYARAEQILATQGTARRPAETPTEYLARVLRSLHVQPDAVLELTTLFQRAKFSSHAVDVGMKTDAISALAIVRDELRARA